MQLFTSVSVLCLFPARSATQTGALQGLTVPKRLRTQFSNAVGADKVDALRDLLSSLGFHPRGHAAAETGGAARAAADILFCGKPRRAVVHLCNAVGKQQPFSHAK